MTDASDFWDDAVIGQGIPDYSGDDYWDDAVLEEPREEDLQAAWL